MTTIHSFPTELIRHTLSLAYPPGSNGSRAGLRSTALVHPSWTEPSKELMTEVLVFDGKDREKIARFIETGPVGFGCQVLGLVGCDEADTRAILAKARPGGIAKLVLLIASRSVNGTWLRFRSLNRLASLEVQVKHKALDKWSLFDDSPPVFSMDPRPSGLRHLAVGAATIAANLFHETRHTLTSLGLRWTGIRGFTLAKPAQDLDKVVKLTLMTPMSPHQVQLHPSLTAFAGSLPSFSTLTVRTLWPQQLEQFLVKLPPTVHLAELRVVLWEPHPHDLNSRGADHEQIAEQWEPTLQRCVRLPAMSAVQRWRLSIMRWLSRSSDGEGEVKFLLFREGRYQQAAWAGFTAEVAQAGIELVLGPLDQ